MWSDGEDDAFSRPLLSKEEKMDRMARLRKPKLLAPNPALSSSSDGAVDGPKTHVVDPTKDTLQGIALKYDVSTDQLRRVNDMTSDRLISHITLIIPSPNDNIGGTSQRAKMNDSLDPALWPEFKEDENRKRRALEELFQSANRTCAGGEARFYLAQNEWNLKKALAHYERDAAWERSVKKSNGGWFENW